jgi:hypothetical protein
MADGWPASPVATMPVRFGLRMFARAEARALLFGHLSI